MSDRDYCYPPDDTVLRNGLNIRAAGTLEAAERQLVAQRLLEPVPGGDFDLAHLKAVHRHLFQDVYEWAGEIRTVEIAKGESRFQPRRFIATGMADIHCRMWPRGISGARGRTGSRRAQVRCWATSTMSTRSARATAARSFSI